MYDEAFQLISPVDDMALQAYAWRACPQARGVLVIAHGLGEHARRYAPFARALNREGYEVVSLDHRGHGASPGPEGLGDPGDAGWHGLVSDLAQLIRLARQQHSDLPVALFGQSLGSFAAQQIAQDHPALVDALVLASTTVVSMLDGASALLHANAAFEPARTPFDWLSRDPDSVDAYIADPFCGLDAAKGVTRIVSRDDLAALTERPALERIRHSLPVLLVAGDADPFNRGLALLHVLERLWREAGVRRIDTQYYPGGRHEMLHETNRDEVIRDIVGWLASVL